MNPTRRRLRTLLSDLARQGVTFTRDGDSVTVQGMTRDRWVREWLDRHQRDLLAILRKPERSKRSGSVDLDDLLQRVEEMAA